MAFNISGISNLKPNPLYTFTFTSNEEEVYYTYQFNNESVITRLVLNQTTSVLERSVWIESEQIWKPYFSAPLDYCDNYGLCGANGICNIAGSPVCRCKNGFKPKSLERWKLMEWSHGGCTRDKPLSCQRANNGAKGKADPGEKKDGTKWVIIVATTAGISGILILIYYIWKGRTRTQENGQSEESPNEDLDLPSFDFAVISIATDNFSINIKLGQGDFGPVFK
ncbi:unnamed protein product, partial [Ilex paraguariensis]